MVTGILLFGLLSGMFLSVLVGLLGSRRTIGFGWAFILSLLFSPLVGLIIVLLCDELPQGSERKLGCLGNVFGILGGIVLALLVFILILGFLSVLVA